MSDSLEIKIVVTPSLLDHVRENLSREGSGVPVEDWVVDLVTAILDGSEFPIGAKRTDERTLQVSYHLRSFSQPLF